MRVPAAAAKVKEASITGNLTTKSGPAAARDRAILCARVAAENRGRDVLVLELTGIVKWMDYMVVATGASRRQIAAIGDAIEAAMKEVGDRKIGGQGYDEGTWLVLDYGDVVVHVFNDEKRDYYQIEHLWGDAPRVEWPCPSPTFPASPPHRSLEERLAP